MKKIAVILAGCGRMDGSEIHESVLTLLSIEQAGADYQCFSLEQNQDHVTNHLTNATITTEKRNMLVESARIARGDIQGLDQLNVMEYDGLIIPGGNGVAYNLCDFAERGVDFTVQPLLKKICQAFTTANKPVGYICIAPVMIPAIYQFPVKLTIGSDKNTAAVVDTLGGIHQQCLVTEICVDEQYKIVSTPAYMLAENILGAYSGIKLLVDKVIDLSI